MTTHFSARAIDLNADLGEGCGDDLAMLDCITSANIACGLHAGDAPTMQRVVAAALARGVAVGAHPSFPDRANFGRTEMALPPAELRAWLLYQLGAMQAVVHAAGGTLAHVKPHGALYNQAARDAAVAQVVARAIADAQPGLRVMCLAGSLMVDALRAEGLQPVQEVFADRAYTAQGSLVARGTPGAVIEDASAMQQHVQRMVCHGLVQAIGGALVPVQADTICLHGDGAHALAFAQQLRRFLEQQGCVVQAPA